ncbi:MAG: PRC-barrel domain-containing protein [Ardenticatenaceae bacterium]
MRRSKELTGKRIISLDRGKDLGIVKDLYFNADLSQVSGLFLGHQGRLMPHLTMRGKKSRLILRSPIILFGEDAILVTESDIVTDNSQHEAAKEWIRRDRVQGRLITTAGGTKIGTIDDVLIDREGIVQAFLLYHIYIQGPISNTFTIMRDAIIKIGSFSSPMMVDLAKAEQQSLGQL